MINNTSLLLPEARLTDHQPRFVFYVPLHFKSMCDIILIISHGAVFCNGRAEESTAGGII
jgi:hypothetical protein